MRGENAEADKITKQTKMEQAIEEKAKLILQQQLAD